MESSDSRCPEPLVEAASMSRIDLIGKEDEKDKVGRQQAIKS
jgi:hypothetical protein